MEVVNVTDCVVMNNMGPSVRRKKEDNHQRELWYFSPLVILAVQTQFPW